jgi:outer membrane protein
MIRQAWPANSALLVVLLMHVVSQAAAGEKPAYRLGRAGPPSLGPVFPAPVGAPQADGAAERVVSDLAPLSEGPPRPQPAADDGSPLTLADAVQLAFDNNPDLRSAEERIRLADALLARARSEFYPTLSASEGYGVTNNPVNAFMFLLNEGQFTLNRDLNHPGTTEDFHTQLLVQHGLYTGGRRRAQTYAAAAGRDAAEFALETAQNELVFRVAEAYYRAFQARELRSVREEAVGQVEGHLEMVRSRERAGSAVKSDVLTVEVRLAEVQEALISSRNQQALAWAVLENVCGAPIAVRRLPKGIPPAPWSGRVREVEAAIADARSYRPEMGQLASQIEAAGHNVRAAEAGKYPSVDLVADYDVFTADFARGNDTWFVGLAAKLTLFDGARTRNDVRQAEAKLRELRSRQRRLMLDIELDVRRTFLQLHDAKQRLEVAGRAVGQAEESLREIEVRYRGQSATITQLVDAQVALSNARVRVSAARAEVEIAGAALEQATGRLREAMSQ